MNTFKQKIKILQKLLNKTVKYSKNFNKSTCYVVGKNIIIEQELKKPVMPNHKTYIPVSDIDKCIKNERSKLFNYQNYEPKDLNKAIQETDIIELRENLKEVME
jgi:hypothetical protein